MSVKKFSKKEAIDFGWQRTKDNLGFFIIFFIILFGIQFFFSFFIELFDQADILFLSIIFNLGSYAVSIATSIFTVKVGLKLYENEKIGSYDFLSFSASTFFKFLLAYLLFSIMVFIGLILLIVPGIYLAIKYQFFMYLIIDKDMDVIESFKESGKMTSGSKWNLFFLALLFLLITILGLLALIVGILVAVPVITVAWAYVYKKLSDRASVHTPPVIPNTPAAQVDNPFAPPA